MFRLSFLTIAMFSFLLFSCDSLNEFSKKSDKGKEDEAVQTESNESGSWSENESMYLTEIFDLLDDAAEAANAAMLDVVGKDPDDADIAKINELMTSFDEESIKKMAEKLTAFADKDVSGDLSLDEFLSFKIKKEGDLPEDVKEIRADLFKKFAGDGEALDVEAVKKLLIERKFVVKRAQIIRKLADKCKEKFEPLKSRVCLVLKKDFGESLGGVHEKFRSGWLEKCKDIEDDEAEGEDDDERVIFKRLPRDLSECEADADCILVESFCSKRAINKKYKEDYEAWWEKQAELTKMAMCPAIFAPEDQKVTCKELPWLGKKKCQLDFGFGVHGS